MNRNRLVMIGVVALALAGFVSFVIYRAVSVMGAGNRAAPSATVVATATELPVGTRLEEKDLRLVKMPESDLPPGVFRNITDVVGRGVIIPMTRSELVLASKLASENGGAGLPSLIPSGMRAVSVKVNDVVAVAGFVTAGTRVDVVLTGNPGGRGGESEVTATTVLGNVQVLAAGQKLQKNDQGEPQQVTVITLLVNPEDAQKLVLASSEGRIQLALRNPLDGDKTTIPVLKTAALYRLQPGPATPAPRKSAPVRQLAKAAAPVGPGPYVVEMIRGDKRDVAKF
jgi:pilus assembly protein CpaB